MKASAAEQASDFFNQGKHAEVVALYQKMLQSTPNDFAIWGNMGISLRHQGLYAAAAACLKRADELSPNSPHILRHYGLCLTFLRRKEEALRAFEAAVRLAPRDFLALSHYGYALREFDMNEKALAQYKAALEIEPENIEAKWCHTELYLQMGQLKEGWILKSGGSLAQAILSGPKHSTKKPTQASAGPEKTSPAKPFSFMPNKASAIRSSAAVISRCSRRVAHALSSNANHTFIACCIPFPA